ncbi:MAG: hypothetical protein ACI9KE_003748 [Polyangiales bacterium]|jgi:hypothetical protein
MRGICLVLLVSLAGCSDGNDATSRSSVTEQGRLSVLGGEEVAGQGDNPVVLEWSEDLTNFSSFADTLLVRENRHAVYRREGDSEREQEFEIPEVQWSAFLAELTVRQPCELVSRTDDDHEEQRPRLTVVASNMRCRVALWDSEWASIPDAAVIRAQIRALFPPET